MTEKKQKTWKDIVLSKPVKLCCADFEEADRVKIFNYIHTDKSWILRYGPSVASLSKVITFCPFCGKKLKKKK